MSKLDNATFLHGDAKSELENVEDESVQTAVTSPPYWSLRDYSEEGQLGLEPTPEQYVENLVDVFREVRRVLKNDGTFWLNIGDSYWSDTLARDSPVQSMWGNRPASEIEKGRGENIPDHNQRGGFGDRPNGLKPKDLCLMPSRVALALQEDGWWIRNRIVWNKPSCMPENVDDRLTTSHEYIFLLTKNKQYYYDADAIRERGSIPAGTKAAKGSEERNDEEKVNSRPPEYKVYDGTRNKRDVWSVNTANFGAEHFAVYPEELIEPCIKAGSEQGDTVLDPFSGAATTGIVALKHGRKYMGVELNEDYIEMSKERIRQHDEVPANHSFW